MTTLWIAAAVVFAIPQEADGQDAPRPVRLGPIAVVSDFLHDFGTVTAGPVLEHTFVVANTGDEPLVITRFNAACGCTSLTDVPEPIEPGQAAEVPVSLRTAWLRGAFRKSVEVHTNETDRPMVLLEVTGVVEARFDVLPAAVSFGKVRPDAPLAAKVSLRTLAGPPMQPKIVLAPAGMNTVVTPADAPGAFMLSITGKAPKTPGVHTGEIVVETEVGDLPELRVPFTMRVESALRASPSVLTFAPGQRGVAAVIEASGSVVLATPTVSVGKGLRASLDDLTPGRRWLLTVVHADLGGTALPPDAAICMSVPPDGDAVLEVPVRVIAER